MTARRWSPRRWVIPAKTQATCSIDFIGGLDMLRSLGAVRVGPENFALIAEQAMDTPWVPRNPRPINGPAQIREILELAA